jgi:succinate dehydrogenase / fumarate reductase membrane anchor subunit
MANRERIGANRLVVGAHYGTLDFLAQRVTAVIMAIYTLVIIGGILFSSELNFETWRGLFSFTVGSLPLGQLLATLFFLSLSWHAWIGVRDIWMDYVKPAGIRLVLHVFTIVWLLACLGWAVQVLWRL